MSLRTSYEDDMSTATANGIASRTAAVVAWFWQRRVRARESRLI